MERRSFLKLLGGVAVAPIVQKVANYFPEPVRLLPQKVAIKCGYTGRVILETGCIYAPYVPLHITSLQEFTSRSGLRKRFPDRTIG